MQPDEGQLNHELPVLYSCLSLSQNLRAAQFYKFYTDQAVFGVGS